MRQTLLRGSALLLGGILLGMLLLMAAYALPTEPIRKHLGESLLCFDGSDGMPEADNETLVKTYSSTWLDIRTDLVMMLIAAYDSDASPWEQALENRMYNDTERYYRLSERLAAVAHGVGKDAEPAYSYGRYWHGYLVLLKPLLLFCSYMDIRMLNVLAQGTLLLYLLLQLKKSGVRCIPALGAALAVLQAWLLPLCLQYSTAWLTALAAMCLLVRFQSRFEKDGVVLFFLGTGMVTSYVDFLTYPLITFGLPCVLWLMLEKDRQKNALLLLVQLALAWGIGYAGMWAGKWLLVLLFGRAGEGSMILAAMEERGLSAAVSPWSAILRNGSVLWRKPYKLALLCVTIWMIVRLIRLGKNRRKVSWNLAMALLVTAAMPLAWYAVMNNHSHVHYFFTYRNLAISVFALGCLASLLLEDKRKANEKGLPV